MSAPPSTIVLGSINTDLVIQSPRLPRTGETVLGGQFFQAAGGKGANQAVAAARLAKCPVAFIAAVGDDNFGRLALENLARENIRADWIKSVAGIASGIALIMVDARGENSISVASGANAELAPGDIRAVPDDVFRQARVFLASLESPLDAVEFGLRRAKEAGLITILNPAPADPLCDRLDLLKWVDILTPNAGEAAQLAQQPTRGDLDENAAILSGRVLQQAGCRQCVITRGAAGCLVAQDEVTAIQGRAVESVDSTGAGDAFNGALAVALAEGRDLVDAARWANLAASISVTRMGAQPSLPNRADVENLAAEM